MFLNAVSEWAPFRIDALGLVTILGANEVDVAVGRLVYNYITEWLPLLGAYTIASNQITRAIPGFVLYNVTDGIMATDLSSWTTRWLLSFPLTYTSTRIRVRPAPGTMSSTRSISALILGLMVFALITVFPVVMSDWWGLTNAISMGISVLVRKAVVSQNRQSIRDAATQKWKGPDDYISTFITLPSGQAVTVYAPRSIIVNCFLTNPRPPSPRVYIWMRALGWISFGIHVASIGMARLFNQIVSVIVLVGSSVLVVSQVGELPYSIPPGLCIDVIEGDPAEMRSAAYARLELSESEEKSMRKWNLFPHKSNVGWWNRYRQAIDEHKKGAHIECWDEALLDSRPPIKVPSQPSQSPLEKRHSVQQSPPAKAGPLPGPELGLQIQG